MGIVVTKEFNEQTGEQQELALPVELDHGIATETVILHSLKHWSIRDIREMLEKFLARNYQRYAIKKTMSIRDWFWEFVCEKNTFKHIVNVSSNEAEALFNAFDNQNNTNKINLLEFVAPMIVTSWGDTEDKQEFTFTLFNSDDDDSLSIDEFTVIVKCFVNGFRRWAHKKALDDDDLKPLAKMLFEKIDINQTGDVDLKECSDVLKNLPEIRDVFLKQEKGKETQQHENVLKKRLTSFAVHKIHTAIGKNMTSRSKTNSKAEFEEDRRASVKVNDKKSMMVKGLVKSTTMKDLKLGLSKMNSNRKATMMTSATMKDLHSETQKEKVPEKKKEKIKNPIKRETQEKLKGLQNLFQKIIDVKGEAYIKKESKQEKVVDLVHDDYYKQQIKKDHMTEFFNNNSSLIDTDIYTKLSKYIQSAISIDQQGIQSFIKQQQVTSSTEITKDQYESLKKQLDSLKDDDKGEKVNPEQDKQYRPVFMKIAKGKTQINRQDFRIAFKDLDDTNFNLGDQFDKIAVNIRDVAMIKSIEGTRRNSTKKQSIDKKMEAEVYQLTDKEGNKVKGLDYETFLKIMLKKDKLKNVKEIEGSDIPQEIDNNNDKKNIYNDNS